MTVDCKDPKTSFSPIGHRFEFSPEAVGLSQLTKKILAREEGIISKISHEGYSEKAFETIMKSIADLKGRKIYESIYSAGEDYIFIWDDAIVEITSGKNKLVTINAFSANADVTKACKEVASLFTSLSRKGYVFAITRNQHSLQLTRVGYAGSAIERLNYTPEVVSDYEYAVNDLKSKDPSGRLIILEGLPGCGKSYIIRGILMDITNAMFIIVPPDMVSSMGGPELLPLLLRTKEDYGKRGPIILILEDADQCLAPRAETDMSSISAILNLSDGIFGSLLDIRIIATTNAKAKDLDRAIVRDGRLSKRISIGPLPYKDANTIYKRLLKDDARDLPRPVIEQDRMKPLVEKNSFTLAEIYKAARDAGWKSELITETSPTSNSVPESKYDYDDYEADDEDYMDY